MQVTAEQQKSLKRDLEVVIPQGINFIPKTQDSTNR